MAALGTWIGLFSIVFGLRLVHRGIRARVHGRRFEHRTEGSRAVLKTELGVYRFDPSEGKLWIRRDDGDEAFVRSEDIRGVQTRVGYAPVRIEEMLWEDWGLTDLLPDYRDHRMYWDVVITTAHGLVPLARLSQHIKRDWFDFLTPVQLWLLRRLGFYCTGAEVADAIEAVTKRSLRAMGLNILGGYEHLAPFGALDGSPLPTDADRPGEPYRSEHRPAAIDLPASTRRSGADWPTV